MPTSTPTPTPTARAGVPAAAPRPRRDGFLDVVRAIAVVRVVAWHTWGAAVLSWLVAAMPAMFFVTGSVLAGSLDRAPAGQVLRHRVRRLLLPFWVFGAVAHAAMAAAWWLDPSPATRIPWWQPLAWVLPVVDPVGTPWEGTWLARPLWYLRVLLWLLAAAPLLRALQRRLGLAICAVPAALTVAAELATAGGWLASSPGLRFHLTDAVTYVTFLLLGFWHHDGGVRRVTPPVRWALAAAGVAGAGAWLVARPAGTWVVNDSPVLLLCVGWAWLWTFLALEAPLGALAGRRRTGPAVAWIGRRSYTIYLWHTTAVVAAYPLVERLPFHVMPPVRAVLLGLTVAGGLMLAAVLFGGVEDRAAGRARPRRRTARTAGLVAVTALWAAVALGPGGSEPGFRPPPPSARPPELVFATSAEDHAAEWQAAAPPTPEALDAAARARLLSFLDRWGDEGAAAVLIRPDGRDWAGTVGRDGGPPPFGVDDVPLAGSLTKSVTALVAHQLAEEGRIDLDAPIRAVPGVPSWPAAAGITMRQLLTHSSGIVSYAEAPGYDRHTAYTPQAAVELSVRAPLLHPPGRRAGYSNSGYLALGILLEAATGTPFETLAAERVFAPLGMDSADVYVTPMPGFIGHASGGMRAHLPDLARLAAGIYRDGGLVSRPTYESMLPTAEQAGTGIGGFCPCATGGWIGAFGADSGTIVARWFRDADVVVVLRVGAGIHADPARREAVYGLAVDLARVAAGVAI